MIELPHADENFRLLLGNLKPERIRLKTINPFHYIFSKVSPVGLSEALQKLGVSFQSSFNSAFLGDKEFVPGKMDQKMQKVLSAIQFFQLRMGQHHVELAIISFISALSHAFNTMNRNWIDLKKYRIGRRVEKTTQAKPF